MRRFIEAGILASAIGITAACGGADKDDQKPNYPDLSPRIEENGIVNFKSKYLGYALKYPINWTVTTASAGYSYIDSFQFNGERPDSSLILISVIPFENGISLDDYADSAVGVGLPEPQDGPKIDGENSKVIDVFDMMGSKSQMIIFVKNGVAYNIEYFAPPPEVEATKEVLNNMLETFKVMDPPQTPGPELDSGLTY